MRRVRIAVPFKAFDYLHILGVDTFCLYVKLLLIKCCNTNVKTTSNLLLDHMSRHTGYKRELLNQLNKLKNSGLINYEDKNYRLNDVIDISIEEIRKKYLLISCKNEAIFYLKSSIHPNKLFTLHAYLQYRISPHSQVAFPSIKTMAKDLGISLKTTQKAIDTLWELGLIKKLKNHRGMRYLRNPNEYKVYDFDKVGTTNSIRKIIHREDADNDLIEDMRLSLYWDLNNDCYDIGLKD